MFGNLASFLFFPFFFFVCLPIMVEGAPKKLFESFWDTLSKKKRKNTITITTKSLGASPKKKTIERTLKDIFQMLTSHVKLFCFEKSRGKRKKVQKNEIEV